MLVSTLFPAVQAVAKQQPASTFLCNSVENYFEIIYLHLIKGLMDPSHKAFQTKLHSRKKAFK